MQRPRRCKRCSAIDRSALALPEARAVYDAIALVETFVDHQDQQQIDHIDSLPAAGGAAAAPLRGLLRRLNLDNEICIKSTAEVRISHRCSRS